MGTGWGRGGHHFLKIKYFITFWYFLKDCDSHHCIDDDECDGIDYGKGLDMMMMMMTMMMMIMVIMMT